MVILFTGEKQFKINCIIIALIKTGLHSFRLEFVFKTKYTTDSRDDWPRISVHASCPSQLKMQAAIESHLSKV